MDSYLAASIAHLKLTKLSSYNAPGLSKTLVVVIASLILGLGAGGWGAAIRNLTRLPAVFVLDESASGSITNKA